MNINILISSLRARAFFHVCNALYIMANEAYLSGKHRATQKAREMLDYWLCERDV